MDVEECEDKGIIRKTRSDKNLINSLIEMSYLKEELVKNSKIDEKSVHCFLPMAYDSLREVLEAFCILEGYKVINHECLGKLIKKLMPEFDYFLFDRFRYVRNGINYYGTKIGLEEGKSLIEKIFLMKKKIINKVKEKL